MPFSSDVVRQVQPPLPLDPVRVARNIQVLQHAAATFAFSQIPAVAQAENTYHAGDGPALVELKILRIWLEVANLSL